MSTALTLMPGLHGTDAMFQQIMPLLDGPVECVNYPRDISQDYDTLFSWLEKHLDWSKPRVLIAESFSGPLALRLARRFPNSVEAVVIAASFCASPINPGLALLPLRPLFMVSPPSSALKHFLTGMDAKKEVLHSLKSVIKSLPSRILSQRIRSVLGLEQKDCPSLPGTPILLLQAQHDNLIPWESQTMLEQHYPHANVRWLDSPHLLLQTRPEEATRYIKDFLGKLTPLSPA